MSPRRIPRGRLAFALAASLVAHLALLALVPFARHPADARPRDTPQPFRLEPPRPIARVTPRPTPTPEPVPTPALLPAPRVAVAQPRPAVVPRRAVRAPRVSARVAAVAAGDDGTGGHDAAPGPATHGDVVAAPVPTPVPPPAPVPPTATPKPVCAHPALAAHVLAPFEPNVPEIARERGATGVASVRVDLSETGAVRGVAIAASTGDPALDASALDAARRSTFAPEIEDCAPRPGTYLFRVEFDG